MIMKTAVLLSWEFPDNYHSPTPYKVQPPDESGGGAWPGLGPGLESGLSPGLGVSWTRCRVGLRLSLGLGLSLVSRLISLGSRLSQNWGLAWDRGSARIQAQCLNLGSSLSLELGLFKDWDLEPGLGCDYSSSWVRGSI